MVLFLLNLSLSSVEFVASHSGTVSFHAVVTLHSVVKHGASYSGVPPHIPPPCAFHVPRLCFLLNISKSATPLPSLNGCVWPNSQKSLTKLTTGTVKRPCSERSDSEYVFSEIYVFAELGVF